MQDIMPEVVDKTLLVVFEGIDNSGKTTVSKELVKLFPGFSWTKEPTFSTEQADRLNSPECTDENYRESLFLESRLGIETQGKWSWKSYKPFHQPVGKVHS